MHGKRLIDQFGYSKKNLYFIHILIEMEELSYSRCFHCLRITILFRVYFAFLCNHKRSKQKLSVCRTKTMQLDAII